MRRSIDSNDRNYGLADLYQPQFDALAAQPWPAQWRPSADFPTPQSVGNDEFSRVMNDSLQFGEGQTVYRLGESHLPIAPYRELVVDTIMNNQRVVISSETGSGKSSQIGLYLLEAGFPRVFISSPRILAARELKERAQYNLGPDYAHLAGYLTGNASDSDCRKDARLIYVTEQLLFKMANRGRLRPDDIIINDEAHERTAGTVVLLGLIKDMQRDQPDMKLIVSSATIDTDKFSRYLTDPRTHRPAPTLILPGRTFPVESYTSSGSVAETAREYMKEGHNVLAFEPGVARIRTTAGKMSSRNSKHTVHELFGDQSPSKQREALDSDDGHHMVANRIAETSVTPEGKTVVVDSGLSNVGRYRRGVKVLETVESSKAVMWQRRGRVGRTGPGIWVQAAPDDAPPPPDFEDRQDYDDPDIENSSVTAYIAELLSKGRRFEDLDLLEYPTSENLRHDYQVLRRLGAIAIENGSEQLTEIGRAMTDVPLDANLGRMLVESRSVESSDEVDAVAVRAQVAAAVAIQQVKGVLNARDESKRRYLMSRRHEDNLSNECSSDVLFQLDVFTAMLAKQARMYAKRSEIAEKDFERLLEDKDVIPNRYYKALRTFEELCRRENLDISSLRKANASERQAIIGCQIAGADELFVPKNKMAHWDIRGQERRLGRRSTIATHVARLVIGSAFDLWGMRSSGNFQKHYIVGASVVSSEQLTTHAPERVTRQSLGYGITREGNVVERQALYFDNELLFDMTQETPSSTVATREFIIRAMMTGTAPSAENPAKLMAFEPGTPNAARAVSQLQFAQALDHRSRADLRVEERHEKLVKKTIRDSLDNLPLNVTDPAELDEMIPPVYVNSLIRPTQKKNLPHIVRSSPDAVVLHLEDDKKTYVPVDYKYNVAFITLPRHLQFSVQRADFAELEEHHAIKVRVANGHYRPIDEAFRQIEEQRLAPGRVKRLERRAQAAAALPENPVTATQLEQQTVRTNIVDQRHVKLTAQAIPVVRKPKRFRVPRRESRGSAPNDASS